MSVRIFTGFLAFLAIIAIYSLHSVSSRDPTSAFFNPRTGYTPAYSTIRTKQAEAFVAAANTTSAPPDSSPNNNRKKLCVGIPSIARKGARYLRGAVGSILEGLTPEERNEIYFVVFIPHSDPTVHPAYNEHWLPELTNEVLVYDVSPEQMQKIKDWEKQGGLYMDKGLYDYSYLMNACQRQETPYIAMLEDDIVAMDGWYHRTMAALEQVETLSALKKQSIDFLYLRLFYTEEFLGWNSEYWSTYFLYSLSFVSIVGGGLVYFRASYPAGQRLLSNRVIMACCGFAVFLILSFFALGRVTVRPLPTGVNYMPQFGCCSQGLVFPRHKTEGLTKWFDERKVGFVDVLTEEYANNNEELRWAITPSVVQHVGRKSSKVDDHGPESKYGMTVAEKIWNFRFERFNADQLRKEHKAVTNQ